MEIDGKNKFKEGGEVDEFVNQQSESIKITHNSRGYNFEFKILSLDVDLLDEIHNKIVAKIKEWEKAKA